MVSQQAAPIGRPTRKWPGGCIDRVLWQTIIGTIQSYKLFQSNCESVALDTIHAQTFLLCTATDSTLHEQIV